MKDKEYYQLKYLSKLRAIADELFNTHQSQIQKEDTVNQRIEKLTRKYDFVGSELPAQFSYWLVKEKVSYEGKSGVILPHTRYFEFYNIQREIEAYIKDIYEKETKTNEGVSTFVSVKLGLQYLNPEGKIGWRFRILNNIRTNYESMKYQDDRCIKPTMQSSRNQLANDPAYQIINNARKYTNPPSEKEVDESITFISYSHFSELEEKIKKRTMIEDEYNAIINKTHPYLILHFK